MLTLMVKVAVFKKKNKDHFLGEVQINPALTQLKEACETVPLVSSRMEGEPLEHDCFEIRKSYSDSISYSLMLG